MLHLAVLLSPIKPAKLVCGKGGHVGRDRGREEVGPRGWKEGSPMCIKVSFTSEHACWGLLASPETQPLNREVKFSCRYFFCVALFCLARSHCAPHLFYILLSGRRDEEWIHLKRDKQMKKGNRKQVSEEVYLPYTASASEKRERETSNQKVWNLRKKVRDQTRSLQFWSVFWVGGFKGKESLLGTFTLEKDSVLQVFLGLYNVFWDVSVWIAVICDVTIDIWLDYGCVGVTRGSAMLISQAW